MVSGLVVVVVLVWWEFRGGVGCGCCGRNTAARVLGSVHCCSLLVSPALVPLWGHQGPFLSGDEAKTPHTAAAGKHNTEEVFVYHAVTNHSPLGCVHMRVAWHGTARHCAALHDPALASCVCTAHGKPQFHTVAGGARQRQGGCGQHIYPAAPTAGSIKAGPRLDTATAPRPATARHGPCAAPEVRPPAHTGRPSAPERR